MIGFDIKDISNLFYQYAVTLLHDELEKRELCLIDLQGDTELMNKIADNIVKVSTKKKDDIEIFVALDFIFTFFPGNSKVYFSLKRGVDHKKITVSNINDFKKIYGEDTIADFAILSNNELRRFQLKQYRNELETDKISQFIVENIKKYGNDLGDVNLLILLQGKYISGKFQNCEIDFHKINKELNSKDYNFTGQVLISYNKQNKKHIINQVYPSLAKSQRDISENGLADWVINNKSI